MQLKKNILCLKIICLGEVGWRENPQEQLRPDSLGQIFLGCKLLQLRSEELMNFQALCISMPNSSASNIYRHLCSLELGKVILWLKRKHICLGGKKIFFCLFEFSLKVNLLVGICTGYWAQTFSHQRQWESCHWFQRKQVWALNEACGRESVYTQWAWKLSVLETLGKAIYTNPEMHWMVHDGWHLKFDKKAGSGGDYWAEQNSNKEILSCWNSSPLSWQS